LEADHLPLLHLENCLPDDKFWYYYKQSHFIEITHQSFLYIQKEHSITIVI
jgi:hypothetical protein